MNAKWIIFIAVVIIAINIGLWVPFGVIIHQVDTVQPQPIETTCTTIMIATKECFLQYSILNNTVQNIQKVGCSMDVISKQYLKCYIILTPNNTYYALTDKDYAYCHAYDWDNGCTVINVLGGIGIVFDVLLLIIPLMWYSRKNQESDESMPLV